jgi:hypothetical protein
MSRKVTKCRADEAQELLRQARERPGVREAMDVYKSWYILDKVAQQYQSMMNRRIVASAANTSGPSI